MPALAKAALPKLVLGDNNFGVDRPGWAWLLPMSYVCLGLPSVRDVARAMPSLACPGTGRVRGPNVACSGGRSPGRKSMLADRLLVSKLTLFKPRGSGVAFGTPLRVGPKENQLGRFEDV